MTKFYLTKDAERFGFTTASPSEGEDVNPPPLGRRVDRFVVSPTINLGVKQGRADATWLRRRLDAEQREAS
jgi:hypothetical protein